MSNKKSKRQSKQETAFRGLQKRYTDMTGNDAPEFEVAKTWKRKSEMINRLMVSHQQCQF